MDYDDYKVNMDYPSRPTKPFILRKSVDDLSDEELASAVKIKKYWVSQCEAYEKDLKAWRDEEDRLISKFKEDLFKQGSLVDKDLHERVYNYAWQEGHSEGLHRVGAIYDELCDVIVG